MDLKISEEEIFRIENHFLGRDGTDKELGLILIQALRQCVKEIKENNEVIAQATKRCDMLTEQCWKVRGKNGPGMRETKKRNYLKGGEL